MNTVEVRFDRTRARALFDAGELVVRPGEKLVVDAGKGLQVATATGLVQRRVMPIAEVRRVIRRATENDVAQAKAAEDLARQALKSAVKRSRSLRLDMKFVHAEFSLDRQKAWFYFASESRVDFRSLSRDLANEYRARVDLRQIFVRDGTGLVGGLGPCGQELCCSTFLTKFAQVSMRHPKLQGLALNPQRINGMCGRLKCCLVYEEPAYKEMRKYAPRRRMGVRTADGLGNIDDVDAVNRTVRVWLHGGVSAVYPIHEVIVLDRTLTPEEMAEGISREEEVLTRRRQRRGGTSDTRSGKAEHHASLNEEYLWDDAAAAEVDFSAVERVDEREGAGDGVGEGGESKSARRRRKKKAEGGPRTESRERGAGPGRGPGGAGPGARRSAGAASGAPGAGQGGASSGSAAGASPGQAGEGGEGVEGRRARRRRKSGGRPDGAVPEGATAEGARSEGQGERGPARGPGEGRNRGDAARGDGQRPAGERARRGSDGPRPEGPAASADAGADRGEGDAARKRRRGRRGGSRRRGEGGEGGEGGGGSSSGGGGGSSSGGGGGGQEG